MDILSARKKAAERVRAKKKQKPEQEPEQVPSSGEETRAASVESVVQAAEAAAKAVSSEPPPVSTEGPAAEPVLAAEGETGEPAAPEIEMLAFRLGSEEYVVLVEQVREVLKMRDMTPVPHAPLYVLGVTSLRGAVLPVIDLCARLSLKPGIRDEKSRIVVVSLHDEETGLFVDRVTGVVRFLQEDVRPAPEAAEQGASAEFIRGIARKNDKLYILLDLEKAVEQ